FLSLWDALRRAGIDAAAFARLAARSGQQAGLTGRRFTALARIAEAYEDALARRGVVDGVGARARLPSRLADDDQLSRGRLSALLDGADTLEVEVAGELPVIRARLWQALARRGLRVRVAVPELPGAEVDAELHGALEWMRRNLVEEAPSVELVSRVLISGTVVGRMNDDRDRAIGNRMTLDRDDADRMNDRPLAGAALIPFVSPERGRALVDPLQGKLKLIDAGDERGELRAATAHIRGLIQSGVAPHRITLALPRLLPARQRVLAALDAAEIPVEELRGQPVLSAAPLRLTFALIDAAERDLPREALAAVLESAYVARGDAPLLLAALRDAGS
ncbi:MAG: hypothetical protein KC457_34200, partial [Myxococcales bacterium]|nr:hypothetical protein [Myxococcales bacterium]